MNLDELAKLGEAKRQGLITGQSKTSYIQADKTIYHTGDIGGAAALRDMARQTAGLPSSTVDGKAVTYDYKDVIDRYGADAVQKSVQSAAQKYIYSASGKKDFDTAWETAFGKQTPIGDYTKESDYDALIKKLDEALEGMKGGSFAKTVGGLLAPAFSSSVKPGKTNNEYSELLKLREKISARRDSLHYNNYTAADYDRDIADIDAQIKALKAKGHSDNTLVGFARTQFAGANQKLYDMTDEEMKAGNEELAELLRKKAALSTQRDAAKAAEVYNKVSANKEDKALFDELYEIATKQNTDYISSVMNAFSGNSQPVAAGLEQEYADIVNRLIKRGYDDPAETLKYYSIHKNGDYQQKASEDINRMLVEHPVLGGAALTAGEILTSPVRGLTGLLDKTVGDTGYDPLEYFNEFEKQTTAVIAQKIEDDNPGAGGKVFSTLYKAGTSAAESLLTMGTFGGGLGGAVMGLNAAVDTYNEGIKRGLSAGQAIATGFTAGVFEALFEHIGWGRITALASSGRNALVSGIKGTLVSMGTEGSEELLTDSANALADFLINGGLSEYRVAIASGMTNGEYAAQLGKQLLESFVVGGISGGLMYGGAKLGNRISGVRQNIAAGEAIRAAENVDLTEDVTEPGNNGFEIEEATPDETSETKAAPEKAKLQRKSKVKAYISDIAQSYTAGRKYNAEVRQTIQNAVDERVSRFDGLSERKNTVLSKALTDLLSGETLDEFQTEALMSTREGVALLEELNAGADWAAELGGKLKVKEYETFTPAAEQTAADRMSLDYVSVLKSLRDDSGASLVKNYASGRLNGAEITAGAIRGMTEDGIEIDADADGGTGATAEFTVNNEADKVIIADSDAEALYYAISEQMHDRVSRDNTSAFGTEYALKTGTPLSLGAANVELAMYDSRVNADPEAYAMWCYELYKAGRNDIGNLKELFIRGNDYATKEQLDMMYKMGLRDRQAKPGVVRIGETELSDSVRNEIAVLNEVFRDKGLSAVVVDSLSAYGENARYIEGSGTVVLSLEAEGGLLTTAAFHEIMHVLEAKSPEDGRTFVKFCCDAIKNSVGEERYNEIYAQREKLYGGNLQGADRTALIESEVAAQYFGAIASADTEYLSRQMKKDLSLWEKVREEFGRFADSIRSKLELFRGKDKAVDAALRADEKTVRAVLDKFDEAWNRANAAEENGKEVRSSFMSTKAATADLSLLEKAETLEKSGSGSEVIRKNTGWFRGYDGKWRFEISDKAAKLIDKAVMQTYYADGEAYYKAKLEDIFDHNDLFKAYPELRAIEVIIQKTEPGMSGAYFPKYKQIVLSLELFKSYTKEYKDYLDGGRKAEIQRIEQTEEYKEYSRWYDDDLQDEDPVRWLAEEQKARDKFFSSELGKRYYQLNWGKVDIKKYEPGWSKEAKSVLLHEIQHAIQSIEGLTPGTNTSDTERYDKSAGEIEARDTAARAELSDEERKEKRPDIDRTEVVFSDKGGAALYSKDTVKNMNKEKTINVTKTQQFRRWFGDWIKSPGSISPELLNEDGTPRIFYHGTKSYGFTAFNEDAPIFLTSSSEAASTYSGVKENPANVDYTDVRKLDINGLAKFMTEHNSDGLKFTVKNVYDSYAGENRNEITVNRNGGGSYSYESALDWALRMKQTPGNYPLYVSADKLLVIDNAKTNRYVPVPDVLKKYFPFENNADTTEIAEAAKSAGFDGVMFKHIGDVAPGYGDGETDTSADVIAVFRSEQVKSAETGTEFANIGTFSGNKDIRFSLQIGSETEDTVKRLQDENAALKEKNDAFFEMIQDLQKTIREEKLDKEHTRGLLPTKTELKRIAAKYNTRSSPFTNEQFADGLEILIWSAITSGENLTDSLTAELYRIMDEIMTSTTVKDDTLYRDYEQFRRDSAAETHYVSQKVYDFYVEEFGGKRNFQRAIMGKLKIAVNPGGSHNTLDSFYSELAEEYPGLLPEEADEYHQIYSILAAWDGIQPVVTDLKENFGFKYDKAGYDQFLMDMTSQMIDDIAAAVPRKTFADRYKARVDAVKEELAQEREKWGRIVDIVGDSGKPVEELTKFYENKIAEVKAKTELAAAKDRAIRGIKKNVKSLNNRIYRESTKNNVKPELRDAVISLVKIFLQENRGRSYDWESMGYTNEGGTLIFDKDDFIKIKKFYDNLQVGTLTPEGQTENKYSQFYTPTVADDIDYLEKTIPGKRIASLSFEEIDRIAEIVANINWMVGHADQVFQNGRNMKATIAADDFEKQVDNVDRAKLRKRFRSTPLEKLYYQMLPPTYFFREEIGGAMTEQYDAFRDAQDKYVSMTQTAKTFLDKTRDEFNYEKWKDESHPVEFSDGSRITLTTEQLLQFYATEKREKALSSGADTRHLISGGIVFDEKAIKNAKKYARQNAKKNARSDNENVRAELDSKTAKEVEGILAGKAQRIDTADYVRLGALLNDEQKLYADKVVEFLSTVVGGWGNEVSLNMFGVKIFKERYYFPFVSGSNYIYNSGVENDLTKLKNAGFTNALTHKAKTPLVLSGFSDAAARHIDAMATYAAFTEPIENMTRFYNAETSGGHTVAALLEGTYGTAAKDYLLDFLKNVNGGVKTDANETFIGKAFSLFKSSAVAGNLQVVIQQPTSLMRSMAIIEPKYWVGKITKSDYNEMLEHAPIAALKMRGGFDIGMKSSSVDWLLKPEKFSEEKAMDKINDVMGYGAEKADAVTWVNLWNACKRKYEAENKGTEKGGTEYYKGVYEMFRDVIDYTQVYDSTLSRSQLLRSKSLAVKMVTAFNAEPTLSFALLAASGKNRKISSGRALAAFVLNVTMNTAFKAFTQALRDKDEDQTYWEKYLEHFASGVTGGAGALGIGSEYNPLNLIPWVKDILSIVQGYEVERPDMSVIGDLWTEFQRMHNTRPENMTVAQWVTFFAAFSKITPVPVTSVVRDGIGIISTVANIGKNKTTRATVWKALRGALYQDDAAAKAYSAAASGDAELVRRLTSPTKTDIANAEKKGFVGEAAVEEARRAAEKRYHSNVTDGLIARNKDITEAAEARYSGNISRYADIVDRLTASGFDRNDVLGAVNKLIDTFEPEEPKETEEPTDKPMFDKNDIVRAVEGGDKTSFDRVRQYMIEKDGKSYSSVNEYVLSYMKEALTAGTVDAAGARKLLSTYTTYKPNDVENKIAQWYADNLQTDYAAADSAIRNNTYLDAASRAAIMKGIIYDDYADKTIDRSTARSALETYGAVKPADVENELAFMDYKEAHPLTVATSSSFGTYYEVGAEASSMTVEDYSKYYADTKSMTNITADDNPDIVLKQKQDRIYEYINALPLTSAEKTMVWKASYSSVTNLYKKYGGWT